MDIVLFGMQGSGKGTQANILAEKFGLNIFEMGAQLRKMAQENSDLGRKIKETIEVGNLVDDETIMDVVRAFVENAPDNKPILFDGIPRTSNQFERLTVVLESMGRKFFGVWLRVSKDEAVKRMLSRGRTDDSIEVIERRLSAYEKQTLPLIKKLYSQDHLIEVDGEQGIEEVSSEMLEKVNYLFN